MSQSTKTDNHHLGAKLYLRRKFLTTFHADKPFSVVDCFSGGEALWTPESKTERTNYMAHNIENKNGKSSIVWTGETPWHKLGQKLAAPFTAEAALKEGGLDFTVEKVGLQTVDGTPLNDKYGLRRTDTMRGGKAVVA